MAKKQYWELYEELKSHRPKTQAYFKVASKIAGFKIDKETLTRVRRFRQEEYYKQGKTMSQAFKEYDSGIKYENAVVEKAYKIWSGEYIEKQTETYATNYLSALERNNVDRDIIDFLRDNKEIIKMGALMPITEFYVPSKQRGKKYHLNIDDSGFWNDSLREFLEDAWGLPKKTK